MRIRLLGHIVILCLIVITTKAQTSPCANKDESGLPLPSSFLPARLPEFQAQLKSFLSSGKYRTLNWCEDKKLRDTGPFVNGVSYGVHPTVKIYYSPAVINICVCDECGSRTDLSGFGEPQTIGTGASQWLQREEADADFPLDR